MSRVQLIVTGDLEQLALHRSLQRVFPAADFLEPLRLDGFTSARIGDKAQAAVRQAGLHSVPTVRKLAGAMVAEVEPGRRRFEVPDLVVCIEDLELANADQPQVVIEHFLGALRAVMEKGPWGSQASKDRAEERLRERCSFHLLCPMVEAYFYGEAAAPRRAGAVRPNRFATGDADVEQFIVDDPDYQTPADGLRWWAKPDRARHPKRYLDFLCTEPGDLTASSARQYRETDGGVRALEQLAWNAILALPGHAVFAGSLFADIADGLGEPWPDAAECSPHTRRRVGGVLRNA